MIIPTETDIAAVLRKLQSSQRRQLDDAIDYLHWRLWKRRGKKSPGIGVGSLLIVCAKAAAVWEQVHSNEWKRRE